MVCFGSFFIRVTLVQSVFVMRVYIPSRSVVSSFVIGHNSALYNIIHCFHGANTLTVMEHVFHFVTDVRDKLALRLHVKEDHSATREYHIYS